MLSDAARRWATRLLKGNPDKPPAFVGPRRPGKPEICAVDGVQFVSYKVHRETGIHKRAVRRARRT